MFFTHATVENIFQRVLTITEKCCCPSFLGVHLSVYSGQQTILFIIRFVGGTIRLNTFIHVIVTVRVHVHRAKMCKRRKTDGSRTYRTLLEQIAAYGIQCSCENRTTHAFKKIGIELFLNYNDKKEDLTEFTACIDCFVEMLRDQLYAEYEDNFFDADFELLDDIVIASVEIVHKFRDNGRVTWPDVRLELHLLMDVERMSQKDDTQSPNEVYGFLFRWKTVRFIS